MDILHYPDPLLKKPAERVAEPKEVEGHVEEMVRMMHEYKGVGIAATQVGIDKRFFILVAEACPAQGREGPAGHAQVLVNPEIVEGRGQVVAVEGCLSLPGLEVKIKRYEWVKLRATTPDGKAVEMEGDGLFARVVQHELDHLNGRLIIDRVNPVTRIALRSRLKEMEKKFRSAKK